MARKKKTSFVSGAITAVRDFDYDRYIALAAGVGISIISAYYSIVGLAAIFAGAATSIYFMGTALEIGKVVTASYLYRNWSQIPILMRAYFTIAVITLMGITSMGTFGYLSKAHIDHVSMSPAVQTRVDQINRSIAREERRINAAQRQLDQLDEAITVMLENDLASRAMATRRIQEADRSALQAEINSAQNALEGFQEELAPYENEIRRVAQEVGPIRYVAEVIYGESNPELLEEAIRWMIIILVIVFDPLAVLLIMVSTRYKRDREVVSASSKYDDEAKSWLGGGKSRRVKAVKVDGDKWRDTSLDVRNPDVPSVLEKVR